LARAVVVAAIVVVVVSLLLLRRRSHRRFQLDAWITGRITIGLREASFIKDDEHEERDEDEPRTVEQRGPRHEEVDDTQAEPP
jgi:hypothetical protein